MLFSEVSGAISFERRNLGEKIEEARNNLIEMHLIQSLKMNFALICLCFQSIRLRL